MLDWRSWSRETTIQSPPVAMGGEGGFSESTTADTAAPHSPRALQLAFALLPALLWALPMASLAEVRLAEVADDWGIDFRHHHGGSGERYMVETMVGGVVVFDYDGDGDDDLFFVDGGVLPGYEGEAPRSRLFRNDVGLFIDQTDRSAIVIQDYGSGASAGDIDGDGDLDLYVTAFGRNQLFMNRGDASFEDVSSLAGVQEGLWSAASSFADVDRDGDLDLYVANYVDFTLDNHKYCGQRDLGVRSYCHPDSYNGVADRFYLNQGNGKFVDGTLAAGFETANGSGLGAIFGDLDNDNWVDLYVANDLTPNHLFRNQGKGRFEDWSLLSGAGYSDIGHVEAGMGVDLGDVDGNGLFDILLTNFELETNTVYMNMGDGLFLDSRHLVGLAEPSFLKLAFGVAFVDLELDGDEDIVVANGHTLDNASEAGAASPYRQENQVFIKQDARFHEFPEAGMQVARASRGLATGDLDLDGDVDVVIVNSNDLVEVYENVSTEKGGFLAVDLVGATGNTFAIGARLELEISGVRQLREVRTGSSYMSQNSLTETFGTGATHELDRLKVTWPSGRVQLLRGLRSGTRARLVESGVLE